MKELAQKFHASALAHSLATKYARYLDLRQVLAEELVKERQNVNGIVLGEEYDSHRLSSVTHRLPDNIFLSPQEFNDAEGRRRIQRAEVERHSQGFPPAMHGDE